MFLQNLPSLGMYISIGFYLTILAGIYLYLSFNVISTRRSLKVTLGDGGNSMVVRAVRAHANFAEYVPFSIILVIILAIVSEPITIDKIKAMSPMPHGLFLTLIFARLCHAYGMLVQETKAKPSMQMRMIGMILTFAVIGLSGLILILNWIFQLAQGL